MTSTNPPDAEKEHVLAPKIFGRRGLPRRLAMRVVVMSGGGTSALLFGLTGISRKGHRARNPCAPIGGRR